MKLCINCQHVAMSMRDGTVGQYRCDRPTGRLDPVTGAPIKVDRSCSIERSKWGTLSQCGYLGRFWVDRGGEPMKTLRELPPPGSGRPSFPPNQTIGVR